jgi:hypothetical protein
VKKRTTAAVALAAGVAIALSTALPASATTITTGAKSCSSTYDRQKSNAKYSVEHKIYSPANSGEYTWNYSNSSAYVTNTTNWNNSAGRIFINDATNSWVNGPYLSSASISCA